MFVTSLRYIENIKMHFTVFFISALALAHGAVIEHRLVDTPLERTSIVGPSIRIVHESKLPVMEAKLHKIEPSIKIIEPATYISEPVPRSKTIVSVVKEVPSVKVETLSPLTHHIVTPMETPIYKSLSSLVPDYRLVSEHSLVPSWYTYPWSRSNYPYYNDCVDCLY